MVCEFFGRGKLLLGGEYLVLDGAQALAVGLNVGQTLRVEDTPEAGLHWRSVERDGLEWFSAEYDGAGDVVACSDGKTAETLSRLLKVCRRENPSFVLNGKRAEIRAGFDRSWGLGSSSTLLYVLSKWAGVDPFALVAEFGGSGYDVAAAGISARAMLYRLVDGRPQWLELDFCPPFVDELFFVYSGAKQDTRRSIERYRTIPADVRREAAKEISVMVQMMAESVSLPEFEALVVRHEDLVGRLLELAPVKRALFPDYAGGVVKSLGAWGGDFLLATGKGAEEYFRSKGYGPVFPFNSMVGK